ncbi:unnamed protein product [Phyllotreta striolata]|uniref:Chromatin modification-related protein YNG2 n=1 Tax=Phyllotreta striolata TaxID=444603 RepID=A0A9N9XNU0_PHYSR|nr:unnamed protein product [Phyllotreta striolata]
MENGSTGPFTDEKVSPEHANNGVAVPIMAKLPEKNIAVNQEEDTNSIETAKLNGDSVADLNEENSYSSGSDALIIDESVNNKERGARKKSLEKLMCFSEENSEHISETVTHSNPYFNESLFELLHHNHPSNDNSDSVAEKSSKKLKKKVKSKPKVREYAQYLGLQPSVQFKCPKCNRSGFESLSNLQDHIIECSEETVQHVAQENSYSGFKLTRKVFLCSACGTYYENWNLYIHMLEFHKRYICLYCLGMFSILEELCQHIQSKHNLEPGYKNTLDEFFNVYNEPCYIACCDCSKLFSEQDNFFYHHCVGKNKNKKSAKQQITPENHVTGESESVVETNNNMESTMQVPVTESCEEALKTSDCLETEENQETAAMETDKTELNCQGSKSHIKNNNISEFDENSKESNEDADISVTNEPNVNRLDDDEQHMDDEPEDTRKVPKLSLKLPKLESYEAEAEESDDSDKLTMEIDQVESEYENDIDHTNVEEDPEAAKEENETNIEEAKNEINLQIAGPDISIIELQLEQPLDKFDPRCLLQKCLKMTIPTCIYCNHARKIAVNGKQLGLHCIAEHRFSAVVNSITAEELIPENFVNRIKESLEELSMVFFNLDSNLSNEAVTYSHLFECFQCHFSTTVHKDLYLHNRKYHSKNLLLCIMCKSNFYSYSELICHLCPGVYVLDYELQFRCCMCVHDDMPSSFRLMVHLRKKHNVCDVCLETCHTQHRLSNHVWKHKLHHFCYRCGIAYRNKPDITRHLFWKHGTESVLCKKCLQKKWPHVYHFCVPPSNFFCDECPLIFTRAVSLKVHKRIHTNEKKHSCTFEGCEEKFISKKLLEKHYRRHVEPPEEPKIEEPTPDIEEIKNEEEAIKTEVSKEEEKVEEKPKQKIDVLEDLPALNLSESDSSSESETESTTNKVESKESNLNTGTEIETPGEVPPLDILQEEKTAAELPVEENSNAVMQNIWDNFKTYQEQQQKIDNMFSEQDKVDNGNTSTADIDEEPNVDIILQDHDYCVNSEQKAVDTTIVEVKPALQESVDHDYCFSKQKVKDGEEIKPPTEPQIASKKINKKEGKKAGSSSSSSSDSDSSSCSCGSNCSCSSSSGSSSSSSDSSSSDSSSEQGKRRLLMKKQKRKERAKKLKAEQDKTAANKSNVAVPAVPPVAVETPIRESDLDTTESETDEEFYDKAPQQFAKKILEEKRQQLSELVGPNNIPNGTFIESTSRPPTPPVEVEQPEEKKKKKSKSKKKKKKKSERKTANIVEVDNIIPPDIPIPPYYQQFHQQQQVQPQSVAPITLTISRISPISSPSTLVSTPPQLSVHYNKVQNEATFSKHDSSDTSLRASKRRRVPNKFYGYSSDEDQDKPAAKSRKSEAPPPPKSPQVVPPITIRAQPTPPPPPPPSQPPIEPISIRTGAHLSDFRVARPRPKPSIPPIRLLSRGLADGDSASDSNDSSSEEPSITPKPAQPQLYCYCQCPYDEVSEMIGCDATDCAIEWFHFECVGIMVPPKGQWFCPDCRKKKARREIVQSMKAQSLKEGNV